MFKWNCTPIIAIESRNTLIQLCHLALRLRNRAIWLGLNIIHIRVTSFKLKKNAILLQRIGV